MKCILISSHGTNIDELVSLSLDYPTPVRKKGEVLIRVKACALAPGDVRVMKGDCDFFQSPRGFPYIPGGDVSGIVQEADENSRFKSGDAVMAMFELPRPLDGLAEYVCRKENLVELKPPHASFAEAACLTSSALAALRTVQRHVKENSRILVLGGGGGVGIFLIQMALNVGASYVCATSTQAELLKSIGVHRVIDYRKEKWWEVPEFQAEPFDCIVDLGVGREESWDSAEKAIVLKHGWEHGKYVSLSGDEPNMHIHSLWRALSFTFRMQKRVFWTSFWKSVPTYIWQCLDIQSGDLLQIARLYESGKLQVILDDSSSSELKIDSVKRGYHIMENRQAHGKVVIEVE